MIYQPGDVVQLKSGGAPLVVIGYDGWLFFKGYRLGGMSPGGLKSEFVVDGRALRKYSGKMTPASRHSEAWLEAHEIL